MDNSLQNVIPADFPIEIYNQIMNRIYEKYHPINIYDNLVDHFYDAWQAVAYRFFACAEHDIAFQSSIERAGNHPSERLEHYIQERELYGFFVTGFTVIESFYYSCYIIASMIDSNSFPFVKPEKIKMELTADKFDDHFSQESISRELVKLKNEDMFKEWKLIRNVLAHRTTPPRENKITLWPSQANPPIEVSWLNEKILININTTFSKRFWLAKKVVDLIWELDIFTKNKFG